MIKRVLGLIALVVVSLSSASYADEPSASKTNETLSGNESIVVAGGCFWGIQAVFQHTKGVIDATSGYAGGSADKAQYETVSRGDTGHAESVKITYDPKVISLDKLLDVYFTVAHNPTELNYQSPDHGTQYRSTVFYDSPEQEKAIQQKITDITNAKQFSEPVVTTLEPLKGFYKAEDYHQNFASEHPYNPYIMMYDAPKISKLKKTFPDLYIK